MVHLRAKAAALAAVAAAAAALAGAPAAQAARYHVVDLGTFKGGSISSAAAINNAGQVVGWSGLAGLGHAAFLWQDGTMRSLGQLDAGQSSSDALAIDSAGQVAGGALVAGSDGSVHDHAFLWRRGRLHDLGLLPGGTTSDAYALNRYGLVVGEADLPGFGALHPVLWRRGVIRDLGTFGGPFGDARGVNRFGTVVGSAALPNGTVHAFRWRRGRMTDLGTLGGAESEANAISAHGRIVGSSLLASGRRHAFALRGHRMRNLGALASLPNSEAVAVNRSGAAVGSAFRIRLQDRAGEHAVVFEHRHVLDLNTLIPPRSGWLLQQATGINRSGAIVGNGTIDGAEHGFLLVPAS